MHGNSRPVHSTQVAPHHRLAELLDRHCAHPYRKPVAPYSAAAFATLCAVRQPGRPLVLDAGCGTGASTFALARRHPDALVVGVDQSAQRLGRGLAEPAPPANALLLRADVVDIWRLFADAGLELAAHYLLYPNPWPKPDQVMRRWPAHPVFPIIIGLGGHLECRSNWRVYVEEFAAATGRLTGATPVVEEFTAADPLTPFERKYRASGHPLYRAACRLPGRPAGLSPAGP